VVLASLGSARQRARDGKRISDLKQIQLALELYYDTQSQYPIAGWSNLSTALTGTFMSVVPNDPNGPATTNSYGYYATPDGCDNQPGNRCTGYHIGGIMETTGQFGVLASDNDASIGGNNLVMKINTVDTNLNCDENATGTGNEGSERLYCTSSL
jgi:type II secretory pathway pseudopilin PulG